MAQAAHINVTSVMLRVRFFPRLSIPEQSVIHTMQRKRFNITNVTDHLVRTQRWKGPTTCIQRICNLRWEWENRIGNRKMFPRKHAWQVLPSNWQSRQHGLPHTCGKPSALRIGCGHAPKVCAPHRTHGGSWIRSGRWETNFLASRMNCARKVV